MKAFQRLFLLVLAAPLLSLLQSRATPIPKVSKKGSVGDQQPYPLLNFEPYIEPVYYSQAAFCDPNVGDVIRGAKVYWRVGNGGDLPTTYIAHSPQKGIIVGSQGTNGSDHDSIMNDLQLRLEKAEPRLMVNGCLDEGSDIHHGFQETWQHTANDVLAQVRVLLERFPGSPVLLTGHSLGGAISAINYVWLRCKLPDAKVSAVLFGPPRVGDSKFANSVDRLSDNGKNYHFVVNGRDPVPHLPPRALGYRQPSGELWIKNANSTEVLVCQGQENKNCADQYHLYQGQWSDHSGWYFGRRIYGAPEPTLCRMVERKKRKAGAPQRDPSPSSKKSRQG